MNSPSMDMMVTRFRCSSLMKTRWSRSMTIDAGQTNWPSPSPKRTEFAEELVVGVHDCDVDPWREAVHTPAHHIQSPVFANRA